MLIPQVNYYLKDLKSSEPTLISMQVKYSIDNQQQRIVLSSGNKVRVNEWDSIKKRAVVTKKNLENGEINLYLDKMETAFKTVFRNCLIDNITPTAEFVREKMEIELNLKPVIEVKVKKVTFLSFFETLINENKVSKTKGTIKTYLATLNRIKDFSKLENKVFDFDDITLEWRANFLQFLQSMNLSKNTEGKHIKIIKYVLNEATDRGLNKNLSFRNKSFTKPSEKVNKIFLTTEEIHKIAQLDLSAYKLKEIVRDFFVIGCLTSLRYSDLIRLKKENISNDRIKIITQKTSQEVIIPVASLVRDIFEKYDYNLPSCPPNQVYNRYLKDIGRMAELNTEETITITIGGVKKTQVFKKWELISSHSARRSMVSNCILEGINSSSIMLLTGHKSIGVFQGYARFDGHKNAEKLSEHSFFR